MHSFYPKGFLFSLMASGSVALLLAYFLFISIRYPYYFIWDMDQVVVMDCILIQSGLLPDHINHPGFGLYLPLVTSSRAALFFRALSATTLSDLSDSLNPLWCIAEYALVARLHTPFVLIVIILSLWAALSLLLRLRYWQAILFLLVLGLMESLAYQASMIRTEQYSVLYWSLAVGLTAVAAIVRRDLYRPPIFFLVGLLLGLSLFSKIQSLILVGAFPILMVLIFSLGRSNPESATETPQYGLLTNSLLAVVGLLNAAFFGWILLRAYRIEIPQGFATFADSFGMTSTAYLFLAGFLVLAFMPLLGFTPLRPPFPVQKVTRILVIMVSGFVMSLLLHFLVYQDPEVSLTYLLYDAKIVFFRKNPFAIQFPDIYKQPLSLMRYNPTLFAVHLGLLGLLFLGKFGKALRVTKIQLALCLFLTLLFLTNLCLAVRFFLRDLIWAEISFNLLSLLFLGIIYSRIVKYRFFYWALGSALIVILLVVQCIHSAAMPRRIAANYNRYGWDKAQWLRPVYKFNHPRYSDLMEKRYDYRTRDAGLELCPDFFRVREIIRFVFANQTVNLKNAGIAGIGFPVSMAHPEWRFANLSPELLKGIVVDNAGVKRSLKGYLKPELVNEHSEVLEKFAESSETNSYVILPRSDLKVYIVFEKQDSPELTIPGISPSPLQIIMGEGGHITEMQVAEIHEYVEIPIGALKGRHFFVICRV